MSCLYLPAALYGDTEYLDMAAPVLLSGVGAIPPLANRILAKLPR